MVTAAQLGEPRETRLQRNADLDLHAADIAYFTVC